MGAVIHAGSTVHRVHAPSTHSLPVIRACNSPFMPDDQTAEITILSISISGIRQLKELSPNFVCIWNHRSLSNEQHSPKVDLSQRSFTFVGFIVGRALKGTSTAAWLTQCFSSSPLETIIIEDRFMHSNALYIGKENLTGLKIP